MHAAAVKRYLTKSRVAFLFCFSTTSLLAQGYSLQLASGTAAPGGQISLDLSLTGSGDAPAALQWTVVYDASTITALSVDPGPNTTASGKSIFCSTTTSGDVCLDAGFSTATISFGVIAVVKISLSPNARSTSITVTNAMGASASGARFSISAGSGMIQIQQTVVPPTTSLAHQTVLPAGMAWCDDAMINGLFTQINAFRTQNGVSPLAMDDLGMKDAELRAVQFAQYMVTNPPGSPGFNPHQGWDTTAASIGYKIIGENLAYASTDPANIVLNLWQDPLHRAAMLYSDANVAGVSCIYANQGTAYWTYEPGSNASVSTPPATTPPPPPVTPPPTPDPTTPNPITVSALGSEQKAFLTLINDYRAQNGAGPLAISVTLQGAAQWMSNDMATQNTRSHTDSLGRSPAVRLAAFGYTYTPWGENIAGGFPTAQAVFTGWQNNCDPAADGTCTYAHRRNMLNPDFHAIGIGSVDGFWTTDFGGFVDVVMDPNNGATLPPVTGPITSPGTNPAPPPTPTPTPVPAPGGGTGSTSPLSFIAPQNGQTISGLTGVSAAMLKDTDSSGVRLSIDGKAPIPMYWSAAGYSLLLNTANISDGAHTLTLSATDLNQINYSLSISVTINNSGTANGPSPAPAPALPVITSFTAAPASIGAGQSSTLFWTVANAASLSLNQNIGRVTGTSLSVSPAATVTYTLTATNAAGSVTASVTVTVQPVAPAPGGTGNSPGAPGPASCPAPATDAFTGCYYNNLDLSGTPALVRTDNQINFNWLYTSPGQSLAPRRFSVRWQGNFSFGDGAYTFTVIASDGVRIYIDGNPILDRWRDGAPSIYTSRQILTQGTHLITVEYYEATGNAIAQVSWQRN